MAADQSRHPTINPKSAAALGGMIEGRRAGWKARERALAYHLGAANKVTKKYVGALDGRQSMNLHTTTNQKQSAVMEGTKDGRRDEREARGKRNTIVLGGLSFDNKKIKNR